MSGGLFCAAVNLRLPNTRRLFKEKGPRLRALISKLQSGFSKVSFLVEKRLRDSLLITRFDHAH